MSSDGVPPKRGLRKLWSRINGAVSHVASWDTLRQSLGIGLGGLFGLGTLWAVLTAMMAAAGSAFDWLYQQGWGAFVYAGVGAACATLLTLSVAAFVWVYVARWLHPPPPISDIDISQIVETIAKQVFREVSKTFERDLIEIRKEVEKLNSLVVGHKQLSDSGFARLIIALRARDAEKILIESDQIIRTIGRKLIACPYEDECMWARDYESWQKASNRTDVLLSQWMDGYAPFFNDRMRDIEQGAPLSPNWLKSDSNKIRYKIVFWRNKDTRMSAITYLHISIKKGV